MFWIQYSCYNNFTSLTAVQFSGGHISLTSDPLKLVPHLKHHLYPQPPWECSWKVRRWTPVRGSFGNEVYSLEHQRSSRSTQLNLQPRLQSLSSSFPEIVLANFPHPLGTSQSLSDLFTSPSIRGKKSRQEVFCCCCCCFYLDNNSCLFKDWAIKNHNLDKIFQFFIQWAMVSAY